MTLQARLRHLWAISTSSPTATRFRPHWIQQMSCLLIRTRRCRGCRHAATPRPFRQLPPPAGTAPGRPAPRNSRSSSKPRRSGGYATPAATAPYPCEPQRSARDAAAHAQIPRTACGAHPADAADRSGNPACAHTSLACAEISHQRFHRLIPATVRHTVTRPRRIPALMSSPVQLSLTLLQRLQRPVLLQGDHDRLSLALPEDHLMTGDLSIERQGTLTHSSKRTPPERPNHRAGRGRCGALHTDPIAELAGWRPLLACFLSG